MPGQQTYLFITEDLTVFENIIPKETQLEVFSHGDKTKIHFKVKKNITNRLLIPLGYDLVYQILAKRRTDLLPY